MLQKVIVVSDCFEIFGILNLVFEDFYVESLELFMLGG